MRIGDSLKVTDGKGHLYQCTLVDNNAKRTTVSIINQIDINQPKYFTLHVAFAPTKQMDRNEWFVEKATEIGIDRFSPLLTNHSERKEIKRERLQKIVIAADRKSTRLNSSHVRISYAVFCLKKKKKKTA